jgi:hypothetical protein
MTKRRSDHNKGTDLIAESVQPECRVLWARNMLRAAISGLLNMTWLSQYGGRK